MTMASRIYEERLKSGKTAADVAREAQISRGYYSEIENGKATSPSALVLKRIAVAIGSSVAYLIGEDEPAEPIDSATLPLGLEELRGQIPEADIRALSTIKLRGFSPVTPEDWRYLYESLKRTLPKEFSKAEGE